LRNALYKFKTYLLTVTTDAPGVTLAGHSRVSKLQAGHADPPVSARHSLDALPLTYDGVRLIAAYYSST